MSGDLVPYDYPMLSMVMVDLQNDQTRGAAEYAELRSMPAYMKHMVGDVQICTRTETMVVGGKTRKTTIAHQWVLYPLISDQEKVTFRGGKRYVKRQISGYMEKYCGMGAMVATPKPHKKVEGKRKIRIRIVDDDEEVISLRRGR